MQHSVPARRVTRSDGAETRRRILDASRTVMLRSGWERTSLREVAAEAGVAKGLVVYHFGSKEGLFVSMQALVFEELAQHIAGTVERVGPSKRTALWALGELVHTTLETQRSVMPLVLELWAIAARDPDARRMAVEGRQWLRGLLVDSLRRVIGEDVSRMALSPDTMADLLMAVLTGMLVSLELDGDEVRVERSLAELEAKAGALLTPRRARSRSRSGKRATTAKTQTRTTTTTKKKKTTTKRAPRASGARRSR